ncbi:MAG: transcriptional repressor [Elusimicrobia bacterium]|nr:transcriptional repressor [Elusimicrobiota bacterium]
MRGPGFGWGRMFRGWGRRMTVPRREILEVLTSGAKHFSAEEIYLEVRRKYPGIGLTTVYRTLEILVQAGVVSKFNFGDGRARYEFADTDKKNHCHVICSNCGRIIDCENLSGEVDFEGVIRKLSKKLGFKINGYHLRFYGLCEECKNK